GCSGQFLAMRVRASEATQIRPITGANAGHKKTQCRLWLFRLLLRWRLGSGLKCAKRKRQGDGINRKSLTKCHSRSLGLKILRSSTAQVLVEKIDRASPRKGGRS